MVSLSSIHTVSQTPVVRPSLVADAARPSSPSSPLKAIEPTTAVSKERSRAENKTPEAGTSAQLAAAARAAVSPQAAVQQPKQTNNGVNQQQGDSSTQQTEQPPAEKTQIQKALDTQIKSLLSNVWKASAKAVDFLLGRDTVEQTAQAAQSSQASEAASQHQADIWPVMKSNKNGKGSAALADTASAVLSYTSKGGTENGAVDSRGRILDFVA